MAFIYLNINISNLIIFIYNGLIGQSTLQILQTIQHVIEYVNNQNQNIKARLMIM
jgi:hypothetical protein